MPDQNDIVFSQQTIDIVAIIDAIVGFFGGSEVGVASVIDFFQTAWSIAVVVLLMLAALFLFAYIYAAIRFNQLAEVESERIKKGEELYQQLYGSGANSDRFDDIDKHIQTDNPNDWKLAIIEADIELERLLEEAGYPGATVGEKLKSARASATMQTINDAWEAHLVRNKIAHAGSDFVLTKKSARETIIQYKRVFTELG